MHDLLKASAAAILAVMLATMAVAQEAPSFDCKKASAPDEKAICENFTVAWLDRQLDRARKDALARADGQTSGALRADQSAWLASRRDCGSDVPCLTERYVLRLTALTGHGTQFPTFSGTYAYSMGENHSGSLNLVHHGNDTLAGTIDSVSGPSFHLCGVHFEGAEKIGTHYLWTSPRSEADSDGRLCKVLFQPLPSGDIRVDSLHCRQFCGARGFFDALYSGAR
ncbi:MAG: lysozyme inhibitor LprI family protein [Pseudomonadota bacterium]